MSQRNIHIVSLTDAGQVLAKKIQSLLVSADVWHKPQPFTEKIQQAFTAGDALIMICATGIVVRTLAPVLNNKHQDPPVIVLDEKGHYVIPLLSGHEGGANDWAHSLANTLSAQLVITTAGHYIAPIYTVGMGCERGCSVEHLQDLLSQALQSLALSIEHIASINSLAIKADEVGLIQLAASNNTDYRTYEKTELSEVEHLLSTKSEYVYNTVVVYGVAESAALYAAQQLTQNNSELVLKKIKTAKATCAIARSYPKDE